MPGDTMGFYDWVQLCITTIGTVALVLTLIVYYRQLRTMGKQLKTTQQQLEATRQGSNGQNILVLTNFLQAEDVRAARTLVIQKLAKRPFRSWNKEDRITAAKVCSSYGVAGVILQTGVIPNKPFIENWGPSIRMSFETLQPLIREMQKPDNAGPAYWSTYEWLYQQVLKEYPNLSA
jgi:hypothetical protein